MLQKSPKKSGSKKTTIRKAMTSKKAAVPVEVKTPRKNTASRDLALTGILAGAGVSLYKYHKYLKSLDYTQEEINELKESELKNKDEPKTDTKKRSFF